MLPEFIVKQATKHLEAYCNKVAAPEVGAQLWISLKKRGRDFTIYECRPYSEDASIVTEVSVAKFRYDKGDNSWSLLWSDRNSRWHPFPEKEGATLESLIEFVEEDPTGIFWG